MPSSFKTSIGENHWFPSITLLCGFKMKKCDHKLETFADFMLNITTSSSWGFFAAVAEKKAHRQRHRGHRIPRGEYSLCAGYDRLQLPSRLRRGPGGQPLL